MNRLEVKTVKSSNTNYVKNAEVTRYAEGISSAIVFLSHPEDKITVISAKESINIEVYDNGEAVFLGNKTELFEILRNYKNI